MPTTEELAADLASAVASAELFAVFQPQVSIATGATVGVEALCRWRHPIWGLIAPSDFIPLAEASGTIDALGLFMLSESLAVADEWRAAGIVREVSVNVSPRQLASGAFFEHVTEEFTRRSLEPGALTIEITESMPVMDAGAVLPRLRALRSLGVGISLDDYGSGHASIEQLESLPLTEVKLDGELIRRVNGEALEPLSEIVDLAHERGIRVVAEGIETLAHLEAAVALDCDRAQGYLIGEPRPRSRLFEV
jgi:EAL domain-containing protein (putative c-di-GMP-specific phosphodiesterase class I)